jgi:hypothetical protein
LPDGAILGPSVDRRGHGGTDDEFEFVESDNPLFGRRRVALTPKSVRPKAMPLPEVAPKRSSGTGSPSTSRRWATSASAPREARLSRPTAAESALMSRRRSQAADLVGVGLVWVEVGNDARIAHHQQAA